MRKRKLKIWKPVVLGFTMLYLFIMVLSTWVMELRFAEEFKKSAAQHLSSIRQQLENSEDIMEDNYFNYITAQVMSVEPSSPFQQFSAALYGTDGHLLAKSENILMQSFYDDSGAHYCHYPLEQLTDGELKTLAEYGQKSYNINTPAGPPPKYRIAIRQTRDSRKLCQILVQEITWEQQGSQEGDSYIDPVTNSHHSYETEGGTNYQETDSKIVWERNYPDAGQKTWKDSQVKALEVSLLFPYLIFGGYEQWLQWTGTEYLQEFDRQIDMSIPKVEQILTEFNDASYVLPARDILYNPVWTDENDRPRFYLALRFESHPWAAATHYLTPIYLMGLVLMLAGIAKIIYTANQISKQRNAVEEMRRDFTNAMAHELKTPLSVIRGFAENLLEHNMEEKRDYYLTQIIGQTEQMDQLTAEMIAISKMDSQQLVLAKEPVSLSELIREQITRLKPAIQEKNLQIQYDCDRDFVIDGDRNYLAKAVWNLLSNAVSYNLPGGRIFIQTDTRSCIIENTGNPLNQEQLTHAFDMFYSGDKSRTSKEKHMGMGLFLARKILMLHHRNLSLENTSAGIRATIK